MIWFLRRYQGAGPCILAGDLVQQALRLRDSNLNGDWRVSVSRQRTNVYPTCFHASMVAPHASNPSVFGNGSSTS
jgi:hypothetical protein